MKNGTTLTPEQRDKCRGWFEGWALLNLPHDKAIPLLLVVDGKYHLNYVQKAYETAEAAWSAAQPRTTEQGGEEREAFEKWHYEEFGIKPKLYSFGTYHSRAIQGRWLAWKASPHQSPGSGSAAQAGRDNDTYPEEPTQLRELLDNLSIIQTSAFVNGERVTKAERNEMEKFIYKTVGTARAWLDDFAARLGVIHSPPTQPSSGGGE